MKIRIGSVFISAILLLPCVLFAQGNLPIWIDNNVRNEQYPHKDYYTGFSEATVQQNETQESALNRAKQKAMGELSDRIRVVISSSKVSVDMSLDGNNIEEQIRSKYTSIIELSSQNEVTGSKMDSYYDYESRIAYAFAYVSRSELIIYYQKQITFYLSKVNGALQTATLLETNGEKMKARQECEMAIPLFENIYFAQDLLTALDSVTNSQILKMYETQQLYSMLVQMLTRLEQGISIYVNSKEDLFGERVNIIANKLKAELAINGCNFTDNEEQADFRLRIHATTRMSSSEEEIVFCYADAIVELYNNHKQKTVFSDELAVKGGSTTIDKAGRNALNNVVSKISDKLKKWIN